MRKKIFLFLSLLLFMGCPGNKKCISLSEAEEIVLYEIVRADTMEWDTTKIRVYELPYMLEAGDTVKIAKIDPDEEYPEENYKDTVFTLREDCWYFYIDDIPGLEMMIGRHVFVYCDKQYEIIYSIGPLHYYRDNEMIEIKW
ncbi:hypothetical protein DRQ20_07380 [bacterium]|nr:MAG: hypothetical protein DRQ20_07380 [bacterium]